MQNALKSNRLYSPSAIGDILRIARERARQEERRKKTYISEQLGMTVQRVSNIEAGVAQAPLEIALDWCRVVEDYTALEQIKHIYGLGLPPTDPRLLESVSDQIINFLTELKEAEEAAKQLKELAQKRRPGRSFSQHDIEQMYRAAKQIKDVRHAATCLNKAMQKTWGLCKETVERDWMLQTINNGVTIQSVSHYEEIAKEEFFNQKMLGV